MKGQALVISLLVLLTACGGQKLEGSVVFARNGMGDPNAMGSSCSAPGRFRDVVTAGKTIRIKNDKGDIIGVAKLGDGKQIAGEMTAEDQRLMSDPAVAAQLQGKVVVGCEFPFSASVKSSEMYVVSLDGVEGDLVKTKQEVADAKGRLILTVK